MNEFVTEFLQHLVNGVSVGTIYALIALGYTTEFSVERYYRDAAALLAMAPAPAAR